MKLIAKMPCQREIIHHFWLATFHAEYDLGEVGFLFCLISPRKHTYIVHTNWQYHEKP